MDKHISALLYDYDCVIVPELGGFVCNYSPAKVHPVQHTFSPPSKQVTFNGNLKSNDGLLANHIARTEKRTFAEASLYIKQFVRNTDSELNKGRKVVIEEVGTLFLDVERNIQFEPDSSVNYLTDSFGLGSFRSQAIQREGVSQRIEKEFKDRVIRPVKDPVPGRVRVRRIVAAAVLVPLIFVSIWIPLKTDLLKNVNFSALNPFAGKETPLYKPAAETLPLLTAAAFAKKAGILQLSPDRIIVVRESTARPDATEVKNSTVQSQVQSLSKGTFYIVGGCFEVFDNALRFASSMKQKGYSGIILEKGLGRLSPVCYSSFNSREEALKELEKIQAGTDPNAWLLAY